MKDESIVHNVTLTHASVADRVIRTVKKMICDRALVHKGAWTIMLKLVLGKYNKQMIHSTTGLTPNDAHRDENFVTAKANSVMKEKYLRNYPNIKEGDTVTVFTKCGGNYTSMKETRSRWSEKIYEVKSVERDMQLNKYYVPEGLPKRYLDTTIANEYVNILKQNSFNILYSVMDTDKAKKIVKKFVKKNPYLEYSYVVKMLAKTFIE